MQDTNPHASNTVAASRRTHRLAIILLMVVPALWSTNFIVARGATHIALPHQLAFGRWLIATGILLFLTRRDWIDMWPQWRGELPRLMVLGATGMWLCGALPYLAGRTTSALNLGLIYSLSPVCIMLLSARVLGEPVSRVQRAGTALAMAGVVVIVFKADWSNVVSFVLTPGDIWVFGAVLSWTAYALLLRRWKSCLSESARLAVIMACGVVCLAPGALVETIVWGAPPLNGMLIFTVALAAIVPGIGAYRAYAYVQQHLGAARAALVLYLGPLYAGVFGWALLGERPGLHHAIGAALILPGIYLANRRSGS